MTTPDPIPTPITVDSTQRPSRGLFVHFMLAIAVVIFLTSTIVLYYHWWTIKEPPSALRILGHAGLDGAIVHLVKDDGSVSLDGTFNQDDSYRMRFFLYPGQYMLSITRNSETLVSPGSLWIPDRQTMQVDFSTFVPPAHGASTNPIQNTDQRK